MSPSRPEFPVSHLTNLVTKVNCFPRNEQDELNFDFLPCAVIYRGDIVIACPLIERAPIHAQAKLLKMAREDTNPYGQAFVARITSVPIYKQDIYDEVTLKLPLALARQFCPDLAASPDQVDANLVLNCRFASAVAIFQPTNVVNLSINLIDCMGGVAANGYAPFINSLSCPEHLYVRSGWGAKEETRFTTHCQDNYYRLASTHASRPAHSSLPLQYDDYLALTNPYAALLARHRQSNGT